MGWGASWGACVAGVRAVRLPACRGRGLAHSEPQGASCAAPPAADQLRRPALLPDPPLCLQKCFSCVGFASEAEGMGRRGAGPARPSRARLTAHLWLRQRATAASCKRNWKCMHPSPSVSMWYTQLLPAYRVPAWPSAHVRILAPYAPLSHTTPFPQTWPPSRRCSSRRMRARA